MISTFKKRVIDSLFISTVGLVVWVVLFYSIELITAPLNLGLEGLGLYFIVMPLVTLLVSLLVALKRFRYKPRVTILALFIATCLFWSIVSLLTFTILVALGTGSLADGVEIFPPSLDGYYPSGIIVAIGLFLINYVLLFVSWVVGLTISIKIVSFLERHDLSKKRKINTVVLMLVVGIALIYLPGLLQERHDRRETIQNADQENQRIEALIADSTDSVYLPDGEYRNYVTFRLLNAKPNFYQIDLSGDSGSDFFFDHASEAYLSQRPAKTSQKTLGSRYSCRPVSPSDVIRCEDTTDGGRALYYKNFKHSRRDISVRLDQVDGEWEGGYELRNAIHLMDSLKPVPINEAKGRYLETVYPPTE